MNVFKFLWYAFTKDSAVIGKSYKFSVPLVLLTGLTGSALLFFAFKHSLMFSVVYGIIIALGSLTWLLNSVRHEPPTVDFEYFLKPSTDSVSLRRERSQKRFEENKDQLLWSQSKRNLVDFWSKAFIVAVFTLGYLWAMNTAFGFNYQQILLLPVTWVIVIWFVIITLFPRLFVLMLLFGIAGIWLLVHFTGPNLLFQLLPLIFTFPVLFFVNFGVMFGPLLAANFSQITVVRPGEAEQSSDDDKPINFDDIQGQDEAKAQLIRDLMVYMSTEKHNKLFTQKGILMKGHPGTGKSLSAKATANQLNAPIILTTGSAFISTFMGIGILVMIYLFFLADRLCDTYGRCVVFIDEAEQVLMRRYGMQGTSNSNSKEKLLYQFYQFINTNFTAGGDLAFQSERMLEYEQVQQRTEHLAQFHPFMMGMPMGGGGGGNMSLPIFLHKLDGVATPPLAQRLIRSRINYLLDAFSFMIPPVIHIGSKRLDLRLPRAKPIKRSILFLVATNVPELIDPAVLRPSRIGRHIQFNLPREHGRYNVAELYARRVHDQGLLEDELLSEAKLREFAKSSVGFSPDQIKQAYYSAPAIREAHLTTLRFIAQRVQDNLPLDDAQKRFWKRHQHDLEKPGWDSPKADWHSLVESLRSISYGSAEPENTSSDHREVTAYHEFAGHFLPMAAFASPFQKPTSISVTPRGNSRGMVSFTDIEEHDPKPQRFWEAQLRVMVGSVVAERLLTVFHESQPGVIQDLSTATRLAANMAARYSMPARKCTDEEKLRYIKYGSSLLSVPDASVPTGIMGGPDPSISLLGIPEKRETILLLLGQAFVDDYRLIKKHLNLIEEPVAQLLDKDEIVGEELEALWNKTCSQISAFSITEDVNDWPDDLIDAANPWYK